MSGHSKWSTIKHKKEITDAKRGKLFSKLSRSITIAVKAGGGADPSSNYKLRIAIDQAKAANMPKSNIEKAIQNANSNEQVSEMVYEGFGPGAVSIIVEVATDNKNRSAQEIKSIFDKSGGKLGQTGSASFNFETKGLIVVEKQKDVDEQMLNLIDFGAEDVEENNDGVEVYVVQEKLSDLRNTLESNGQKIMQFEITRKPKTIVLIEDSKISEKLINLLETLDDSEDVQKVYANVGFTLEDGEKDQ